MSKFIETALSFSPIGLLSYSGEIKLREILTSLTDRFLGLVWVGGFRI